LLIYNLINYSYGKKKQQEPQLRLLLRNRLQPQLLVQRQQKPRQQIKTKTKFRKWVRPYRPDKIGTFMLFRSQKGISRKPSFRPNLKNISELYPKTWRNLGKATYCTEERPGAMHKLPGVWTHQGILFTSTIRPTKKNPKRKKALTAKVTTRQTTVAVRSTRR